MRAEPSPLRRLTASLRHHQRAWIVAWLGTLGLLLLVVGGWGVLAGGAERAVDAWNRRPVHELERLEARLAAGEVLAATEGLEDLDRRFPARTARHRFDKERERLLVALGTAYRLQDRKGRALDTFRRLAAFDPRNWRNHWALAEAALAFGEDGEAALALDHLLALHPSHLPALSARLGIAFEGGRYAEVPRLFETWLDGYLLVPLELTTGGDLVRLEVPADGRWHELELPWRPEPSSERDAPAPPAGTLALGAPGFSLELDRLELVSAPRAGVVEPRRSWTWRGAEARAEGCAVGPDGACIASAPRVRLSFDAAAIDAPIASARLRLRLFKSLDAETWSRVEKSYRDTLDAEGLARARERARVGGHPDAGTIFPD